MIPSLQYLIAEHLQINGKKSTAYLADRFDTDTQNMRTRLRQIARHGYIKSEGGRPQIWSFVKMPLKTRPPTKFKRIRDPEKPDTPLCWPGLLSAEPNYQIQRPLVAL